MSEFFVKWDKIMSWEEANHPLPVLVRHDLSELSLSDLEQELDRRARKHREHRYGR